MTTIRQRKPWFAILAILLVFAACKGETPTAPPVGGGNPPTGGGGSTSGTTLTVSVSPQSLEVNRTSVITATVTVNGAAAPDGTAVEFSTNLGVFADTSANTTIRTTTGGVAAASLTSAETGTAVVTVSVANAARTTQVVFGAPQFTITATATPNDIEVGENSTIVANITHGGAAVPNGTAVEFTTTLGTFTENNATTLSVTTTNGVARATLTAANTGTATVTIRAGGATTTLPVTVRGSTRATITGVTPSFGRPSGGETIRIQGTNFRQPVRVYFDVGEAQPREGMVVSVTPTEIAVVTPPVNLAPGQQLQAPITVVFDQGTASETRLTASTPFSFRATQLTPSITTVSPNSGPPQGGTIVTIFGSNFDTRNLQVLFGQAEARIIESHFDNIKVQAPASRDTTGTGAEPTTGAVDVTVVNIASNTRTTLAGGFRYTPGMSITAISPNQGSYLGGTRITIDGVGFDDPVAVSVAGVGARVIDARSGTKLIVETVGVALTSCADITGPIIVTNIDTGVSATGPSFIYRVPKPAIVSVTPSSVTEGGSVSIVVANAQPGVNRIKLGDRVAFATATTFSADGSATFTVTVPSNYEFQTQQCTVGGVSGERQVPLRLDVSYQNVQTTCSDLASEALTVQPTSTACVVPPPPNASLSASSGTVPNTVAAGSATGTTTFSIRNTGGQPLDVSAITVGSTTNATVTVSPASGTVEANKSLAVTVTVDPTAAGPFSGTINIATNDPDTPNWTFTFSGTGI